ncbi:hypothetical protein [Martelella limonii]|uniref:hypothetical protein n=1 Tax=Martelella limonii TaxID=1647649 RepID=UPI0019D59ADA|nr:hypothetical protein [Martelella limonii]
MVRHSQPRTVTRRSVIVGLALLGLVSVLGVLAVLRNALPRWLGGGGVAGIVWQLDTSTTAPEGNWQRLGVDHLLIQWSEVDGIGFAPGLGKRPAEKMPDWARIGQEPWARSVILGLAGNFSERASRDNVLALADASAVAAKAELPLNVVGYYFPVEVDPTWKEAPAVMPEALARLPRPLWISVYDSANIGGAALAGWLAEWLPDDVGIFFQDGVGVEARTPRTARDYADQLAARFGKHRVRVIAEAFRPLGKGRFRPATAAELVPQIRALSGYQLYLFDGPHYVDDALVDALAERL